MGGVRKRPVYKIVVADSRAPRDGRFVEKMEEEGIISEANNAGKRHVLKK